MKRFILPLPLLLLHVVGVCQVLNLDAFKNGSKLEMIGTPTSKENVERLESLFVKMTSRRLIRGLEGDHISLLLIENLGEVVEIQLLAFNGNCGSYYFAYLNNNKVHGGEMQNCFKQDTLSLLRRDTIWYGSSVYYLKIENKKIVRRILVSDPSSSLGYYLKMTFRREELAY